MVLWQRQRRAQASAFGLRSHTPSENLALTPYSLQLASSTSLLALLQKPPLLQEGSYFYSKDPGKTFVGLNPALTLSAHPTRFTYQARTAESKQLLETIAQHLPIEFHAAKKTNALQGAIPAAPINATEEERLRAPGALDLVRALHGLVAQHGFVMGALSFEAVDYFETLPHAQNERLPRLYFNLYLQGAVHEHEKNTTTLFTRARGEQEAHRQIKEMARVLEAPLSPSLPAPRTAHSTPDQQTFERHVARLQARIQAGDIFQAVPSRTFCARVEEKPLAIFQRLCCAEPAPYRFYFPVEDAVLMGASPEPFLHVHAKGKKKHACLLPIAGTRPRGRTPEEDARLEVEMAGDEKERAEHAMLLDLARNDLARVSKPGSRHVTRAFVVEKHAHVQHLVSEVRATLKNGLDALHALQACFPAGTVSGAPKIEAIKQIRACNPDARGYYAGALGVLTNNTLDMALTIRSIFMQNGVAQVQAGAGVVFDSVPARESQETLDKARACLESLGVEVKA